MVTLDRPLSDGSFIPLVNAQQYRLCSRSLRCRTDSLVVCRRLLRVKAKSGVISNIRRDCVPQDRFADLDCKLKPY